MTQTTRPTKQAVRDWLDSRHDDDDAPPTPDEIRRQLGWHMVRHPPDKACDDDHPRS